ncbi:MAG: hypothetical protein M3O34_07920 [Chloroflexota bacterium]|nr:hypothetical protein [Chloroflexota bacterium]
MLMPDRFLCARPTRHREPTPLRTVYNSLTRQYEELPLTEFQLLLRQGKIQGHTIWGDRPEIRYRIV